MKKINLLLSLLLIGQMVYGQVDLDRLIRHPWVDSLYRSMTVEQRIAQLIWINVTASDNLSQQLKDAELLRKHGFGGIIFFEGDAVRQAELTNFYRSVSTIPPLVVMDAEWGIGMRLPGVMPFPYNMTMAAGRDTALAGKAAGIMAEQMKRIGINIALAPSCDINTEALNPIIGMRSFGESRDLVASFSLAFMQGLQKHGIMATAKHFPGHGDTRTDSHVALPVLPYTRQRIDSLELYPFRKLAEAGIGCIMTAHLQVPAIDSARALPSSLSSAIVKGILKDKWHFRGLTITDAMNMKGATSYGKPGQLEVKALKAGNDVVEFPADAEKSLQAISEALRNREISAEEIELRCRRVLAAKLWCGLNHPLSVEKSNLLQDLNSPEAELMKRKIIESSLTLLENRDQLLPVGQLEKTRIAALSVGSLALTPFQKMLGKYTRMDFFNLGEDFSEADLSGMQKKLESYDLVITGIHGLYEGKNRPSLQPGKNRDQVGSRPYGVKASLDSLVSWLIKKENAVAVFFSSPYALGALQTKITCRGVVLAYQNDSLVQELAAQMVFGGTGARGRLPVSVPGRFAAGDGLDVSVPTRLKYTTPAEVGIDGEKLGSQVDSIVGIGLAAGAYPGCNVLVAKEGKVIFHKAYGYHTYDRIVPEKEDDLYDLASVTKITGGLPLWMKLFDEGKIDLDGRVSAYYPMWRNRLFHRSDKSDITIRELLSHQSGLTPFIPFYKKTMKDGVISPKWYSFTPDKKHTLHVARGLYLDRSFPEILYNTIRKSPLKSRGTYVYSDLPFVLTPEIITKLTGESFVESLENYFYKPLGAYRITYDPSGYSDNEIIPTEKDNYYRMQQLLGTVHDESSAVLGGHSGNAGLFASANDLAKLYQMYLQNGSYGGRQYLKSSTLQEFSRVQFPQNNNRRGLGFDKPLLNNDQVNEKNAYPVKAASPESFGHSGYTGTFVWIDPKYQLVYIFLSNRVYPTRSNNKISELNIRTEIQRIIYQNLPGR